MEKMKNINKAYLCPIAFGVLMILIGLFITVPGNVITTYSSLNGEKTDRYEFDNRYSTIDEYVGGDAYNYEIGASLIAGKTSGAMASRSIFIAGGLMCICCGCTLILLEQEKEKAARPAALPSSPGYLPIPVPEASSSEEA